jgi:hypothetical protein
MKYTDAVIALVTVLQTADCRESDRKKYTGTPQCNNGRQIADGRENDVHNV